MLDNDDNKNEAIERLFENNNAFTSFAFKTAEHIINILRADNINTIGDLIKNNTADLFLINGINYKYIATICYAMKRNNLFFDDFINSSFYNKRELFKYLKTIDDKLAKKYKTLCAKYDSIDAFFTIGDGIETVCESINNVIEPIASVANFVDDVAEITDNGRPIEQSIYKNTEKIVSNVVNPKHDLKNDLADGINMKLDNNLNTKSKYNYKDLPTVPCQEGKKDNKTVIVLSAPGSLEEKNGAPAQGETGKNLAQLVKIGFEKNKELFPSPDLKDYMIINASEHVHYMSKTGDTEATKKELFDKENLERLSRQTKDKNSILCFGDKATDAINNIADDSKNIYSFDHPSNQKLNRKYKNDMFDDSLTPSDRHKKRVELWAEESINNINKKG